MKKYMFGACANENEEVRDEQPGGQEENPGGEAQPQRFPSGDGHDEFH